MKNLRVLKLGYESKHYTTREYECQGLVDRVADAAGKTLEVLTLTASWNWSDRVGQPLRCLRRFERLRELELNTGVLYAAERDQNTGVDLDADYDYSCGFYSPDYESDGDDDDEDMDQDDANNRNDNGDASSEQKVNRFYLDGSEAALAKTCPSLDQLMSHKSLGTLEKLTVHVRPKKADVLCLKRLLRNLHGVGVGGGGGMDSEKEEADTSQRDNANSKSTGNSRGGSNTLCPRLTSLTVCLYCYCDPGDQKGPDNVISLAQEYLGAIPGCKVGFVPNNLHFDMSYAAWHASVARGEKVGDEAERHRS